MDRAEDIARLLRTQISPNSTSVSVVAALQCPDHGARLPHSDDTPGQPPGSP